MIWKIRRNELSAEEEKQRSPAQSLSQVDGPYEVEGRVGYTEQHGNTNVYRSGYSISDITQQSGVAPIAMVSPSKSKKAKKIMIFMKNFNSLKTEKQKLRFLLHMKEIEIKPDILIILEINVHDAKELNLKGYKLISFQYLNQKVEGVKLRGGVAIYQRIKTVQIQLQEVIIESIEKHFDVAIVKYIQNDQEYVIVGIYRNQRGNVNLFNHLYIVLLEGLEERFPKAVILIVGDFNLRHRLTSHLNQVEDEGATEFLTNTFMGGYTLVNDSGEATYQHSQ